MKIGRVQRVPVRELWEREDTGFTVWLEQNVDVLGEALGLELSVLAREQAVGPFRADLVAEDDEGRLVIIENQLEPTNHDHLGKVVTYFANLEVMVRQSAADGWRVTFPDPGQITQRGLVLMDQSMIQRSMNFSRSIASAIVHREYT